MKRTVLLIESIRVVESDERRRRELRRASRDPNDIQSANKASVVAARSGDKNAAILPHIQLFNAAYDKYRPLAKALRDHHFGGPKLGNYEEHLKNTEAAKGNLNSARQSLQQIANKVGKSREKLHKLFTRRDGESVDDHIVRLAHIHHTPAKVRFTPPHGLSLYPNRAQHSIGFHDLSAHDDARRSIKHHYGDTHYAATWSSGSHSAMAAGLPRFFVDVRERKPSQGVTQ